VTRPPAAADQTGQTGHVERALAEDLAAAALTAACAFAAGATLWCVSPQSPAHGRHVAVEFVHPVVVGTRALPAVHLDRAGAAGALRLLARPGDLLLVIADATDQTAHDLLRRADAWGVTRLWVGAGRRPPPSLAEHTAWLEGIDLATASRTGDIVLCYHLLWELTHVVLAHPGLLESGPACPDAVCITCSDEGRIGEVRAVHPPGHADVVVGGTAQNVDVSLVDPVCPGELVLVHAGVALTVIGTDP
jgi:hypothetical protein